jgi:uncharacterized membrane protein YphA (DoxX/SURF4 family)
MAYVGVAARAAMFVVFAVSAAGKLRGRRHFLNFAVSLRPFVPARSSAGPAIAAAGAVCAAECTVALLLALPAVTRYGCLLAVGLVSVFTVATGWAVATGRRPSCRCFGAHPRPIGAVHVIRNAALVLVAACGLDAGTVSVAGAVVAMAAGGVGALIAINADDLTEPWRPAG